MKLSGRVSVHLPQEVLPRKAVESHRTELSLRSLFHGSSGTVVLTGPRISAVSSGLQIARRQCHTDGLLSHQAGNVRSLPHDRALSDFKNLALL